MERFFPVDHEQCKPGKIPQGIPWKYYLRTNGHIHIKIEGQDLMQIQKSYPDFKFHCQKLEIDHHLPLIDILGEALGFPHESEDLAACSSLHAHGGCFF